MDAHSLGTSEPMYRPVDERLITLAPYRRNGPVVLANRPAYGSLTPPGSVIGEDDILEPMDTDAHLLVARRTRRATPAPVLVHRSPPAYSDYRRHFPGREKQPQKHKKNSGRYSGRMFGVVSPRAWLTRRPKKSARAPSIDSRAENHSPPPYFTPPLLTTPEPAQEVDLSLLRYHLQDIQQRQHRAAFGPEGNVFWKSNSNAGAAVGGSSGALGGAPLLTTPTPLFISPRPVKYVSPRASGNTLGRPQALSTSPPPAPSLPPTPRSVADRRHPLHVESMATSGSSYQPTTAIPHIPTPPHPSLGVKSRPPFPQPPDSAQSTNSSSTSSRLHQTSGLRSSHDPPTPYSPPHPHFQAHPTKSTSTAVSTHSSYLPPSQSSSNPHNVISRPQHSGSKGDDISSGSSSSSDSSNLMILGSTPPRPSRNAASRPPTPLPPHPSLGKRIEAEEISSITQEEEYWRRTYKPHEFPPLQVDDQDEHNVLIHPPPPPNTQMVVSEAAPQLAPLPVQQEQFTPYHHQRFSSLHGNTPPPSRDPTPPPPRLRPTSSLPPRRQPQIQQTQHQAGESISSSSSSSSNPSGRGVPVGDHDNRGRTASNTTTTHSSQQSVESIGPAGPTISHPPSRYSSGNGTTHYNPPPPRAALPSDTVTSVVPPLPLNQIQPHHQHHHPPPEPQPNPSPTPQDYLRRQAQQHHQPPPPLPGDHQPPARPSNVNDFGEAAAIHTRPPPRRSFKDKITSKVPFLNKRSSLETPVQFRNGIVKMENNRLSLPDGSTVISKNKVIGPDRKRLIPNAAGCYELTNGYMYNPLDFSIAFGNGIKKQATGKLEYPDGSTLETASDGAQMVVHPSGQIAKRVATAQGAHEGWLLSDDTVIFGQTIWHPPKPGMPGDMGTLRHANGKAERCTGHEWHTLFGV